LDPMVGSGNSVTPSERMQTENLTAIASAAADAPGLEQPEGEQPEIAGLAGFDEALGDPPPHAVNPIPTATRVASRAADRQPRRPLLAVWDDSCSPLGQRRVMPTSIYRLSTCCQPTYLGAGNPRHRCASAHSRAEPLPDTSSQPTPQPPKTVRARRQGSSCESAASRNSANSGPGIPRLDRSVKVGDWDADGADTMSGCPR